MIIGEKKAIEEANAKIVVLGDSKSGKSSLINSIDLHTTFNKIKNTTSSNNNNNSNNDHLFYSIIEYPSSCLEYEGPPTNIYLKVWEYGNTSQEDCELAYRGALFCVIVVDIRSSLSLSSSSSPSSSFQKWLDIRNKYMNESFLFVIGTYCDDTSHRMTDMTDMCRLCAQHDGVYLEVSNNDGTNITLLRKLLSQRLSYMLNIRDKLKNNTTSNDNENDNVSNELKTSDSNDSRYNINSNYNTPFLEQEIVADSVGSILSSCLGNIIVIIIIIIIMTIIIINRYRILARL